MGLRVVILGGGFGGLYAATAFRDSADISVTVIDRRNFHLFQPLLYQVATGELSPGDIAFPLRAVLGDRKNTRVLLGEASDLDAANRRLILADGGAEPYDVLIVSTGARNHYFGNESWAERAPGLKSVEDATRIRHRILYAFEAAERTTDPGERRAWLTFVVVGAGPTGVELAGALGEIANDTLRGDFRNIRTEEAQILLLDNSERVLSPFTPALSARAERALIRLGVRSVLGVKVTDVDASGVTVQRSSGEREHIRSNTVIWAAGVAAASFGKVVAERTGAALDRSGRVVVDEFSNVPGHPEIFVIGDGAHQVDAHGKLLPGVAPVAMQQGRYVADVIRRRLSGKPVEPFRYLDKGSLAVIGRASAVAQFGGDKLQFHGLFAWLVWLFVHLMYLVGFQNRLVVFIRWAFNYFTYNRGARLITGDPMDAIHEPAPSAPEPLRPATMTDTR
jgi:NADH dehydrogenase